MLKIDGAPPKLAACILVVLSCVACNSDPEPEVDAAMPVDEGMLQADADDNCNLDVPDAVVDVSQLDVSSGLLGEFGGRCKLSNVVLASAADIFRSADDTAMDWEVSEFLQNAKLNVYSIGTAEFEGAHCPAVVWSLVEEGVGRKYNVSGTGKCAALMLPHFQLFNPEHNPDGQLAGDYIREVMAYNGALPNYFDYKGTRYRFVSEEKLVQDTVTASSGSKADRSILGGMEERYIYWVSGDKDVDNGLLSTDQALVVAYRSEELIDMPPPERALAALQRSYGAPSIAGVRMSENEMLPGLRATVETSSGDEFVMIMESGHGFGIDEMSEWLLTASSELLVLQSQGVGANENLVLDGALFSDGEKTIFGQLEPCDCSTQGVLGWLGEEQMDTVNEISQSRQAFIDRARKTARVQDWVHTSEFSPRAISYVISRYDNAARNSDSAFVVHDGGSANTLYVAMELACNEELIEIKLSGKSFTRPAICKPVDTGGVAYTFLDESKELAEAINRAGQMSIGLLKPDSDAVHEEFQFSLMGSSNATKRTSADEANFSELVVEHFNDVKLSEAAEDYVLAQLKSRPIFCRPGFAVSGCVVEIFEPTVAAAKPVVRKVKPVAKKIKTASAKIEPLDYTMGYASVIAGQLGSGGEPACTEVVNQIMDIAKSSGAADKRAQTIDLLVGRAPNICF